MWQRFSNFRILSFETRRYCASTQKENWYFDYQRVEDFTHLKWVKLVGRYCATRFIAVRRQLLLDEIIQDESLVASMDSCSFRAAAQGLDAMLTSHYKENLKKLKSTYNPLSVDRETVQMRSFSKMQLLKREEIFLHQVNKLLEDAHFYKLPENVMRHALEETNVGERVVMSVSPEDYETLCFWVVGMDVAPLDLRPWYIKAGDRAKIMQRKNRVFLDPARPRNYTSFMLRTATRFRRKIFGEEISRIERYKRVVVAYRMKGDLKLHLKSFKDIPCENLEFLLPAGKMKIRLTDKIQIAMTWLTVTLAVYLTTISNLVELRFQYEIIALVALSALTLRSWSAYNNMRIKCLCNISQTLYFGAIATNYALLTLIADRAEDEVYKTSLLILALLCKHRGSSTDSTKKNFIPGLSAEELKTEVEQWLTSKFNVGLDFSVEPAISLLIEKKLLNQELISNSVCYSITSLDDIATLCPRSPIHHPANSLDIRGDRAKAVDPDHIRGDEWMERPFEWR